MPSVTQGKSDDALADGDAAGTCSSISAEGQVQCSGSWPRGVPGADCSDDTSTNHGAVVGSFEWKVSYALAQDCTLLGSQLAKGGTPRQPMLCPAAMQAATKQQGRCAVPPTPCHCDGYSCSSTPK